MSIWDSSASASLNGVWRTQSCLRGGVLKIIQAGNMQHNSRNCLHLYRKIQPSEWKARMFKLAGSRLSAKQGKHGIAEGKDTGNNTSSRERNKSSNANP